MEIKVKIPKLVKYSLKDIGNTTLQKSALKIYAALYQRSQRKDIKGYFSVPSLYLKAIHARYYKVIDKLIEDGIIEYYQRVIIDPVDLFEPIKKKKFYSTDLGLCMKYKFLIDIESGDDMTIDMDNNRKMKWYDVTYRSLEELGYDDIKISRDDFGRRVHHNLTQTYKEALRGQNYFVIDAKCSQPRLLYILLKQRGVIDKEYNYIFDNKIDFYIYIAERLNLTDRQQAKDLFMYWVNSEGYVPTYNIHNMFPEVSKFIKKLKSSNYKDSSSFLQREEAKIWIDDLLTNVPVQFALSIHDSLIVKGHEGIKVLKYCKERQPQIEFDIKEL